MTKKVVILCNDFPPLNSVAALRPNSWYQELMKYDIYPIVVTRKWPDHVRNLSQKFPGESNETETLKSEQGTIIRSAYRPDLKSRLIAKHGFEKYVLLRKFLTAVDLILGPVFSRFDELYFLKKEADRLLSEEKVDLIIASGAPFRLFKYADALSKKYNTPWIADYRDPFSMNKSVIQNLAQKLIEAQKKYFERKWTRSALAFTTVSRGFLEIIGNFIEKKGHVIRNGFDFKNIPDAVESDRDHFIINYIGTVYDSTYVDVLIDGLYKLIYSPETDKGDIKVRFVGIELNHTPGTDKVLRMKKELPENIELRGNCSNEEAMKLSSSANVVLNLNYGSSFDGIIPVKLYEYLALKKIVISIEIRDTYEEGFLDKYMKIAQNTDDFFRHLLSCYLQWKNGEDLVSNVPESMIQEFSREFQAKQLAHLIHELN